MSKLHHRKFARFFPATHPRAGQPTYFVEQIQNSLCSMNLPIYGGNENCPMWFLDSLAKHNVGYKHHTIRAGHNVKVGDFIRPSVWSGKPYASKQIIFAPDIEVKQTWDFEVDGDGCIWIISDKDSEDRSVLETLAKNDGLTLPDLQAWFNKPFTGQIICWNENVEY